MVYCLLLIRLTAFDCVKVPIILVNYTELSIIMILSVSNALIMFTDLIVLGVVLDLITIITSSNTCLVHLTIKLFLLVLIGETHDHKK